MYPVPCVTQEIDTYSSGIYGTYRFSSCSACVTGAIVLQALNAAMFNNSNIVFIIKLFPYSIENT